MRIALVDVERGEPVTLIVDGVPVAAYAGESIVATLLNSGCTHHRVVFCNMGVCGDCTVEVTWPNGDVRRVRGCLTRVVAGLKVRRMEIL